MNKHIWIINEYAGSPYHGMEFRHYYLAKELKNLGHDITIISASYSHLFKNLPNVKSNFTFEDIDGIKYFWIKVNNYGNAHNKKRFLKWLRFSFNLFRLPINRLSKPDTIIVSPTAPFPILPAYVMCKRFKSKLIYEVKDIWPLTLIELGGFSRNHPLIKIMSFLEKFALKNSDHVVSNLPNYDEHIRAIVNDKKFEYIPNGIDMMELQNIEPLKDEVIQNIPKNKFIVGYIGTMGVANALDYLIGASKILEHHKDIVFVLVGDGQEKKSLQQQTKNLKNVIFFDSIPKKQVQSILSFFDICYIGWHKKRLYEFGVSANKLFDYMYSGKPILHSIDMKEDIISEAHCVLSVEAENSQAIADGILQLYKMSENNRKQLGKNGREFVLKHHTYGRLAKKYNELI